MPLEGRQTAGTVLAGTNERLGSFAYQGVSTFALSGVTTSKNEGTGPAIKAEVHNKLSAATSNLIDEEQTFLKLW